MARTVLVTGGSGFIGSHVMRLLVERGDRVISFDTRRPGVEAAWWLRSVTDLVEFHNGNMEDMSSVVEAMQVHKPTHIVHIAAITNPVLLNRQPSLAFKVNMAGTLNMLEAVRLFDVQRIIHFSSIGVLPSVRYEPIDANHPTLLSGEGPGASFYGAAKLGAEAFCWAYHQAFGIDFITIRPSAVYGFGQQWPIYIKPIVENAVRGIPTTFEHGRDFPRDYTHVLDVAQLVVRALEAPEHIRERTYYAATGQPLHTPGDIATIVKDIIPDARIEVGPGLSDDDLVEIRYRGVLDTSTARSILGYNPEYEDIRKGIEQYIKTYQTYLQ